MTTPSPVSTSTTYNQRSTLFCPDGICQKPNGLNSVEFVSKSCLRLTSIIFMSANYIPFFETTLLEAACSRIPQTKPFHKISIPLWKKDCEVAVKNKKHALNRARRTRSPLDILIFKRCRAKEGKVILEAKHSTWRSYCTSINSNTKLSTVWTTIKKVSGSLSYTRIPQLENNGIVASNDQHKTCWEINLKPSALLQIFRQRSLETRRT